MKSEPRTYDVFEDNGQLAIRCRICGRESYNKNDVEQKYCGNCHQFHDILLVMHEKQKHEPNCFCNMCFKTRMHKQLAENKVLLDKCEEIIQQWTKEKEEEPVKAKCIQCGEIGLCWAEHAKTYICIDCAISLEEETK